VSGLRPESGDVAAFRESQCSTSGSEAYEAGALDEDPVSGRVGGESGRVYG